MKSHLMLYALLFTVVAGASKLACAAARPSSFADQAPPPPPNYASPNAWVATPDSPGPAATAAPGATKVALRAKVDVFYVHPTTFHSADQWNQNIDDVTLNKWTDESVVARQAGAFNGCCRIFAPRYRQASDLSLGSMDGDGARAFDLAYQDLKRAFEYYLQHDNHGRPFMLVGHSQGAFHVAGLLKDEVDDPPLAKQFVAGYVIGYNLSEGDFGKTYKTLKICATPVQTGCVVGWSSVLPEAAGAAQRRAAEARYVHLYGNDPGKVELCVNPLTFDRSQPSAEATESLGVVPGDPGYGPLKPLAPHAVRARCEQGQLIVEPLGDLGLRPLPGGSMHYHDIGLFYAYGRANALLRSEVFLKSWREP